MSPCLAHAYAGPPSRCLVGAPAAQRVAIWREPSAGKEREVNVVSVAKGGAGSGLLGRNHSAGAHERP